MNTVIFENIFSKNDQQFGTGVIFVLFNEIPGLHDL